MQNNIVMIECEVCARPFDQKERAPRIFSQCGHTVCTDCLQKLIVKSENNALHCVYCRTKHELKGNIDTDINLFPKNLSMISLMDVKNPISSQHICLAHDQKAEFICLDSKCQSKDLICHKCLLNSHKTCSTDYVMRLSELKDKVIVEDKSPEMKDMVESLKASIKQRISQLQSLIDDNLAPLLLQLENLKVDLNFEDIDSIRENIHKMQPAFDQNSKLLRLTNKQVIHSLDLVKNFSNKINYVVGDMLTEQIVRIFKETQNEISCKLSEKIEEEKSPNLETSEFVDWGNVDFCNHSERKEQNGPFKRFFGLQNKPRHDCREYRQYDPNQRQKQAVSNNRTIFDRASPNLYSSQSKYRSRNDCAIF